MTEAQTISWIFLAIALASQKEPTDIQSITMIADGINHAVPSQQELKTSITWLATNDFINKNGEKYLLSTKGKLNYEKASQSSKTLLKIWKDLEMIIKNNG